jgi:hypothetical protein
MVDSSDCYDLGYQNAIILRPIQHNSGFHPWTGH